MQFADNWDDVWVLIQYEILCIKFHAHAPCTLRLFWLLALLSPSYYSVSINVTGPTSSQFVLKADTEYWLAHSVQISGTLLFGCCVVKIFRFGDTSEQEGVCTIIYPYWLGWLTKESADSQYIIYYSVQITNTNPVARISVGNVCFCKPQICWNFTFGYVATLNFQFYFMTEKWLGKVPATSMAGKKIPVFSR